MAWGSDPRGIVSRESSVPVSSRSTRRAVPGPGNPSLDSGDAWCWPRPAGRPDSAPRIVASLTSSATRAPGAAGEAGSRAARSGSFTIATLGASGDSGARPTSDLGQTWALALGLRFVEELYLKALTDSDLSYDTRTYVAV